MPRQEDLNRMKDVEVPVPVVNQLALPRETLQDRGQYPQPTPSGLG